MTGGEHRRRKRVCEHCGRTWIAFGLRGERCVWCRPSIPEDARQLALDDPPEALVEAPDPFEHDGGLRARVEYWPWGTDDAA
jgi:hypothetical protein